MSLTDSPTPLPEPNVPTPPPGLPPEPDPGPAPPTAAGPAGEGTPPAAAEELPWAADLLGLAGGCSRRRRGQRLVAPHEKPGPLTPEQRLLLLDTWQRSGLPAGDFAALVGLSKHTLYAWKRRFDRDGPGGLVDRPKGGPPGSRLPELTKRTILLLKQSHPDWGCQKISDLLLRGPALPASAGAVARVLHEAGYEMEEFATHPHPDHVRRFERARPNQLWQTDLFTFVLAQPS